MNEERLNFSEFAIVSLTVGILSFIQLFGAEKGIAAVVFGLLALKRITPESKLRGKALAIAGVILGAIYILGTIVIVIRFLPQWQHVQNVVDRLKHTVSVKNEIPYLV